MSTPLLRLDEGFFTMSPSVYSGPDDAATVGVPSGAVVSPAGVLSSEHPAKKTPVTSRAITTGITHDDLFMKNCTSSPYKNRYRSTYRLSNKLRHTPDSE
jgi:hypothetical protein